MPTLIEPRKNTLKLLEAFSFFLFAGIDAELRLAGKVRYPHYGRQLQERIDSLGLRERVVLLGEIDSRQVAEELATASIFALVSLEENSPMGIEEAMAVGVPVVTSNRCGMPYMVRDGESGFLVDPHRSSDIAWRLGQLLNDDLLRLRMGTKARQIAEDRFYPSSIAERTRGVYLQALSQQQMPLRVAPGGKESQTGCVV